MHSRTFPLLAAVVLALLTAALYWPTVSYEFVGVDDPDWVTENPHVSRGLSGESATWAFTTAYRSNWLPLTWISLMLDASPGAAPDPARYHRTNVLLHALGTLLLCLALQRLTGDLWTSLFVAALFALHPLRVESVAWVTERKDVLSGVFWFAAMGAYAQWVRRSGRTWYPATLALLALGLMAKAMLVTLPAVFLLLDVWPLRRETSWRRRILEKVPMIGLVVVMSVVTLLAQRAGGAVEDLQELGLGDRLVTAVVAGARYVQLTVWPDGLSYLYLHPALVDGSGWSAPTVLLALLLLAGLSAIAIAAARRGFAPPLVGWLWFLGTLVPVIGLVQVGQQWMADRYTYIPQIGLWMALAWSLRAIAKGRGRVAVAIGAVLVTVAFAAQTRRQLSVWQDSEALFTNAVRVDDRNFNALNGLGVARARAGDTRAARHWLERSLAVKPQAGPLENLGNVATMERDYAAAIEYYDAALELEPGSAATHTNLANACRASGQLDRAERHYRTALQLDAGAWRAWAGLGRTLAGLDRWTEAQSAFERALNLQPGEARLRDELDTARRRAADAPGP